MEENKIKPTIEIKIKDCNDCKFYHFHNNENYEYKCCLDEFCCPLEKENIIIKREDEILDGELIYKIKQLNGGIYELRRYII